MAINFGALPRVKRIVGQPSTQVVVTTELAKVLNDEIARREANLESQSHEFPETGGQWGVIYEWNRAVADRLGHPDESRAARRGHAVRYCEFRTTQFYEWADPMLMELGFGQCPEVAKLREALDRLDRFGRGEGCDGLGLGCSCRSSTPPCSAQSKRRGSPQSGAAGSGGFKVIQ